MVTARVIGIAVMLAFAGSLAVHPINAGANGVAFANGDLLAGATGGQVFHYNPSGTLVDTLNNGLGTPQDTGMCFSPITGDLFATDFASQAVSEFDPNGNLVNANFGSGYNLDPESCQFNSSGDMFVGQADGSTQVLEFDSSGNLLNSFSPAPESRGTDWISLASDQCTLFYTSEGSSIKRFNVCTNTQLADFATGLPGPCYENAIRPNGEVMVGCASEVVLLDTSGNVLQTYPASNYGDSSLFAMNLDPDGTSFWTADYNTGQINKIDIATGNNLQTIAPGTGITGLLLKGAINVGADPQITVTGDRSPITGTEGQALGSSTQVATFTDPDTTAVPTDYTASIDWGDGATTSGTISGGSGSFTVSANHTYVEDGTFTATVTVTDADNPGNTGKATSTATIADAGLSPSCATPTVTGFSVSGSTATFTDAASPSGTLSDFSATIHWGDGSSSAGTVSGSDGGPYTVSGSHTYATTGPYTIGTDITDVGGSTASTSTSNCMVTAARVSSARVVRHAADVVFHWRMGIQSGVVGFNLYVGTHRLNPRVVPVHRSRQYTYTARWSRPGHFSLQVLLRSGQQRIRFHT
jgi:hypothetical protein